jgi:hypothetical protein
LLVNSPSAKHHAERDDYILTILRTNLTSLYSSEDIVDLQALRPLQQISHVERISLNGPNAGGV